MSWRKVLLLLAKALRKRLANSCPRPGAPSDEASCAYNEGRQFVYSDLADELEYVARMSPADGLKAVRKWGAP